MLVDKIKNRLVKNGALHMFYTYFKHIIKGYNIYLKLLQEYGGNCKIYVGQHPGTGDVYLQSMFLTAYAEKQKVDKYVFTVIGGSAYAVTKLFDLQNIKILTIEESNDLVCFYRFSGEETTIEILHYHPMMMYYGCLGYLRNYHGLNFYKMMENFVFPGVEKSRLCPPKYTSNNEYLNIIFQKCYLIEGKTVLLAPYANSLISFPVAFWERLVKALNMKGYTVCTNSSGPKEPPIYGTCPLYIPYKYLDCFVAKAGYVISYRSGFSDMLSSICGKKIILYAKQEIYDIMGGLGSSFDYFSLNKMFLYGDALEYEISLKDDKDIDRVIKMLLVNF